MCGGTPSTPAPSARPPGLSPRVRGNRLVRRLRSAGRGSIPACAGEPQHRLRRPLLEGVYPRVCGGTGGPLHNWRPRRGLSPRVRGNLDDRDKAANIVGSIPACAGEPTSMLIGCNAAPVYPRVCGGTDDRIVHAFHRGGLSPRVRGNLHRNRICITPLRSIPACAGEPWPWSPCCPSSPVYPRVCGGTNIGCQAFSTVIGLSPRVRGNRGTSSSGTRGRRSIPACAGEPSLHALLIQVGGVYPRVCGGTRDSVWFVEAIGGLSPRVRGNPARPPV